MACAPISVDGYYDLGLGPCQSSQEQQQAYPLSQCMSCGCCLEACPQCNLVQVQRSEGESDAEFQAGEDAVFDKEFSDRRHVRRCFSRQRINDTTIQGTAAGFGRGDQRM